MPLRPLLDSARSGTSGVRHEQGGACGHRLRAGQCKVGGAWELPGRRDQPGTPIADAPWTPLPMSRFTGQVNEAGDRHSTPSRRGHLRITCRSPSMSTSGHRPEDIARHHSGGLFHHRRDRPVTQVCGAVDMRQGRDAGDDVPSSPGLGSSGPAPRLTRISIAFASQEDYARGPDCSRVYRCTGSTSAACAQRRAPTRNLHASPS